MILIKVFGCLNAKRVRYLVVGGVATVLYGNPRMTKDLDIWVDPDENNLQKVVQAFRQLKFIPRIPVKMGEMVSAGNRRQWRRQKGMLAFTMINPRNPFANIDLLFEGPVSFSTAFKRKKNFLSGRTRIPVISRLDLIRMKREAGRFQDLEDVKILRAARLKGST